MNKLAARMARMNRVQNRTEALLYLQKHNLVAAHAFLSISNLDGNKALYHNNDHCLTVTKWCGRLLSMIPNWTLTSPRGMLLGAIFHDIHHSGGAKPDTANVAAAVQAMVNFTSVHNRTFNSVEVDVAKQCIECTVFPFTVEPETFEQKIIRDADVLQYIDIDFESILVDHLRLEIEVTKGHMISRKQFATGTLEFLETIQMYTEPGQVLWAASKPVLVERLTDIAAGIK